MLHGCCNAFWRFFGSTIKIFNLVYIWPLACAWYTKHSVLISIFQLMGNSTFVDSYNPLLLELRDNSLKQLNCVIVVRRSFTKATFVTRYIRYSFTDHSRNLFGDRWWSGLIACEYIIIYCWLFCLGSNFHFVNLRCHLRSLYSIS